MTADQSRALAVAASIAAELHRAGVYVAVVPAWVPDDERTRTVADFHGAVGLLRQYGLGLEVCTLDPGDRVQPDALPVPESAALAIVVQLAPEAAAGDGDG